MSEAKMEKALRPFGWLCGPEFWERYYTDPWLFNLANAVERLTEIIDRGVECENCGWFNEV